MFNLKKVFLALTVAMASTALAGTLSVSAATSGDFLYEINGGGTATITEYTGLGGNLVIPDTLDGIPVTHLLGNSFANKNLTSVVLPESLTIVDSGTFDTNPITQVTINSDLYSAQSQTLRSLGFREPLEIITIGASADSLNPWFFDEVSVQSYQVHPDNASYADISGGLYTKDGSRLVRGATNGTIALGTVIVGDSAFYGTGINTISVPDSVTSIEDYALGGNLGLRDAIVLNETVSFGTDVFYNVAANFVLKGFAASTTEAYATATGLAFEIYSAATGGTNAAIQATIEVIAGDLSFANELVSLFADRVVLNGYSQTITALFNDTLDVIDTRGNHEGYDIQVTTTDLVSGTDVISKDNITFKSLNTISADGVTGPAEEISAASGFSLINLGQGKGIGQHTMDFSAAEMDIFLSEKTKAGLYTGNIELSLVTSP